MLQVVLEQMSVLLTEHARRWLVLAGDYGEYEQQDRRVASLFNRWVPC